MSAAYQMDESFGSSSFVQVGSARSSVAITGYANPSHLLPTGHPASYTNSPGASGSRRLNPVSGKP